MGGRGGEGEGRGIICNKLQELAAPSRSESKGPLHTEHSLRFHSLRPCPCHGKHAHALQTG